MTPLLPNRQRKLKLPSAPPLQLEAAESTDGVGPHRGAG